jgi:NO-binding membrane sensor protein with MHYT domain
MELPRPANPPHGYRQGLVTAITVFLGFSLSFMRFWGIERPGDWTWRGVLCASVLGVGIIVELVSLYRALHVRDDEISRYTRTVAIFFTGVAIVVVGVLASIVVAA